MAVDPVLSLFFETLSSSCKKVIIRLIIVYTTALHPSKDSKGSLCTRAPSPKLRHSQEVCGMPNTCSMAPLSATVVVGPTGRDGYTRVEPRPPTTKHPRGRHYSFQMLVHPPWNHYSFIQTSGLIQ
jgi:hypothetical protein